ncbi:uncharacterized protein LOC139930121 [Centroberyx gerrardi]|uniref:uncharacterized protein n=1 Tax=Centroberyx gerrardi TaxID=166262 RepID=UPI003AAFEE62
MERVQPLFMRTYGKRGRKISAWLSPDNRKQAFESTATSDGDISVFEPAKPTRIKERRTSVASCRAVRLAKRKAMVCLEEEDSDEENINIPSPPPLRPTRQNKTTRKSKLVSTARGLFRQKALQGLITSESEDDSTSAPKRRKIRVQRKINSDVDVPSVGRFVTHRRGAVSSKPKFPKATVNVLNSSDDFAPRGGASVSRRIPLPSRHPRAFTVSSTENSVNAAGSAGSASNPFREISLNESADHSLGPCTRKPLFCSTPSARPLGKRPHLKPFPIGHQSSTSPSISVSHIGLLSSSQEDVDSPGKPFSPPQSAPVGELSSGEKQQSTLGEPQKEPHHCVEPSGHSVMKQRSMDRSSCSEGAKSRNEATETQNGGEVPSQKLFSLVSSETEGSSHFVSVAGRLEWLVEALKDNCLTQRCTVQLERVDKLTVALLHSQTPYSSSMKAVNLHSW